MSNPFPNESQAFRALERRLTRRRWALLDVRLRWELALLTLLLTGFLFWQLRVPFDGLARARGPASVAGAIGAAWLLLAALNVSLTAARHDRRLRNRAFDPPWLSLPIDPRPLGRHLAWESRARGAWVGLPAVGVLAAAFGLVPVAWLVLFAAVFAWLWLESGRLGCAIGFRSATRAAEARPGLVPLVRVLATVPEPARRPLTAPARRGEARLTGRVPRLRQSAALPVAAFALSLLVWALPSLPLEARHLLAFVLAMLAAGTCAEWLVALSGVDPFAILRTLPVGVGTLWRSRMTWVVLATAVLAGAQALATPALAAGPRRLFLFWLAGATFGIATLGVHYAITLFPKAEVAQRLLSLSLALAMIASFIFPLSGWLLLIAALVHSARRLSRWDRLEET